MFAIFCVTKAQYFRCLQNCRFKFKKKNHRYSLTITLNAHSTLFNFSMNISLFEETTCEANCYYANDGQQVSCSDEHFPHNIMLNAPKLHTLLRCVVGKRIPFSRFVYLCLRYVVSRHIYDIKLL